MGINRKLQFAVRAALAAATATAVVPAAWAQQAAVATTPATSELEEVVVTDSVPLCEKAREVSRIRVLSVSELLARGIHSIHEETSISELFF